MKLKIFLFLCLSMFLRQRALAALGTHSNDIASGTVPSAINYQARITESGFPVSGSRTMTFKLYDASSGGNELWAGSAQTVSVVQGLLSTTISISTSALVGSKTKYLEVKVGDTTLSPREPLMAVPYAIIAKSLEDDRLTISTITVGTLVVRSTSAVAGHVALAVQNNAGTELMRVQQDGSVGIATANPGRKLGVGGDVRVGEGGTTGCLDDGDGTVLAGACVSDSRLKKDVRPLTGALEKITSLRPVTYEWRSEDYPDMRLGSGRKIGLLAQEVEEVLPELVSRDVTGFRRVSFGAEMDMFVIQALKEQQAQIEALREEIKRLQAD